MIKVGTVCQIYPFGIHCRNMLMIALDTKEAFLTTRVNRPSKPHSVFDHLPLNKTYYINSRVNPEFNADLHEVLIDLKFLPTNCYSNVYAFDNEFDKSVMARAIVYMPLC